MNTATILIPLVIVVLGIMGALAKDRHPAYPLMVRQCNFILAIVGVVLFVAVVLLGRTVPEYVYLLLFCVLTVLGLLDHIYSTKPK